MNTESVMSWQLIVEDFSLELTHVQGSKNIVVDTLSRLDKLKNLYNTNPNNNDNKVETILESLSGNFALNKEDILDPTSFKSIMTFQQKGKSIIPWGR